MGGRSFDQDTDQIFLSSVFGYMIYLFLLHENKKVLKRLFSYREREKEKKYEKRGYKVIIYIYELVIIIKNE